MIFKTIVTGTLLALLLSSGVSSVAEPGEDSTVQIDDYLGGVAFLLDGEVCLAGIEGGDVKALTQTDGKVVDFRLAPDLRHIAYSKVTGEVAAVGLFEEGEEVPMTEIWSIVIVNLATMEAVHEITPEYDWLEFGRWAESERLLYYSSSGFDVSGFYQYDLQSNTVSDLDYHAGHRLLMGDQSADGDLMIYVDDVGLGKNFREQLHVVREISRVDRVVLSRRRISIPRLSHDLRSIAFCNFEKADSEAVAIIWNYDLSRDSLYELVTLPGRTRGNSFIAWSSGDSCLGLFHAPSQYPNGYIFALDNPSDVHVLSGKQYCWVGDNALLYSRGESNLYIYDLITRQETLLIEKATHPVYLRRAE